MNKYEAEQKLKNFLVAAKGKLPPMMGWSTWNQFKQNISEPLIMRQALAIKETGLLLAGYRYINLDDCWQASERDSNGRLSFDVGRFPSKEGIVKKLNALGFKAGLYSSCGELTCEDMPGSYGHEEVDAATLAAWGVEYLKYDYCHVVDIETDPHFRESGFATDTPPISYIGVTSMDGGEETRINAPEAELTEPATLLDDSIVGLCCPRASARILVNVPIAGQYQIAIGYTKKRSTNRKFALLTINGSQTYEVWFPRTSGWNNTARATINVTLNEGANAIMLTNPIRGQKEDSIFRYARMGQALKQAAPPERPIFFSICEHGRTEPWTWATEFAGSWRISGDIRAKWAGIMNCYESAADLWQYQQPGAYNDPDMLEVGVDGMTYDENLTHFALWCMLSAPLILGMDARKLMDESNAKTLDLIKNPQLIAINQDALLLQSSRTQLDNGLDLLLKPLSDGSCAVCLFNKADHSIEGTSVKLKELTQYDSRLCLHDDTPVYAKNVLDEACWFPAGEELEFEAIKPHGVALFLLKNG